MSVISRVTVVPSRLIALVKTLVVLDAPTDRRAVMAMLFPDPLRKRDVEVDGPGKNAYEDELMKEAQALGILRNEGAAIGLSEAGRSMAEDPSGWLHGRLTNPATATELGQRDMPSALVWMLVQDPLVGLDWQENHAASLRAALGDDLGISNLSDFQQLFHWARYLGYSWWVRANKGTRVIPDPTVALKRAIEVGSLPTGTRITVREFIDLMGRACPVLEGGAARAALAGKIGPERAGGLTVGHFSASTGLALERLKADGIMKFERLADAEFLVAGPPDTTSLRISHVTVVRGVE